jgi:protocatechuate 3,4-dioxygenase beta subunit
MSIAVLGAVVLLAQATSGSQSNSARTQTGRQPIEFAKPELKPEEYSRFEGLVVDANTEAPLNKVRLALTSATERGDRGFSATTDASGRFLFDRVEPGRYNLWVERNGYSRPGSRRSDAYTLSTGQHLKGVVIKLTPAAVITGRVVDEDGDPVPYARVMVMQYRRMGGKRELFPAGGGGATNDLGEYRIFGIPPGRYYVSASFDDSRSPARMVRRRGRTSEAESGYATQYYPGVFDASQTAPLQVRAGEERSGIDFRLSRVTTVRISGRVVSGVTGKPMADVSVGLMPRQGGRFAMFRRHYVDVDSQTGEFSVTGVQPGAYILSGQYGDREIELYARLNVDVGQENIEGLHLQLAPGINLSGRVTVEGGKASESDLAGIRMFLQPQQENDQWGMGGAGKVDGNGSFEVRNLAPGDYFFQPAGMPEGWYVKAVRLGNQDVLLSGFSIEPGSAGQVLNVTLSPLGGRLEGIVLDGEKRPFLGATVVLVPQEPKRARIDFFKVMSTDQNGYFQFAGIAPGEYKLFAWDKIDPGAYLDPAFLEPNESDGVKVSVKESSQQSTELKLILVEEPEA